MAKYTDQELIRRNALKEIQALGIDPYPANTFSINTTTEKIKINYSKKKNNTQNISIAGRIMSRRIMGKASFVSLKDEKGEIQLYLNRDEICPNDNKEMYNTVFKKLLDIGDIIGVQGVVFTTKVGEISVRVKNLTLLSKSLRPLPIVKTDSEGIIHDEFKNTELKSRHAI